jgi:RNA polymerase sigma-70 factor (ECF subfamily)
MDLLDATKTNLPDVKLSAEQFSSYLAERALSSDSPNVGDLYLACACASREAAALRAFDRTIMSQLPAHLSRLRPSASFIDEVGQILREKLFTGATPKITEYSGRGTLLAWFKVVAIRTAIDLKRTRGEQLTQLDPQRSIVASADSPELAALRNRYRPLFKHAFSVALESLTSEQRTLLRLHYADGLVLEEIGRLFHVNRSTIFRRLNACVALLVESLRDQLGAQLGLNTAEFDSLVDGVRSDLELSLSSLADLEV